MLFSELKEKEVICTKDCRKLGHIIDLEFDECKGCIVAVIVKDKGKWSDFFCCGEEIKLPYHKICKIGPDIILVDL
jgi:YlmC/YmxH family sporulation protein